ALQGNAVSANGFHGRLVYTFSLVGGIVRASCNLFPLDLHAGGFQNAARRDGNFRADSFARDEGNLVFGHCILLYAKRIPMSKRGEIRVSRRERRVARPFESSGIM